MRYPTPNHFVAFTTDRQGGYSQGVFESNNLSYTVNDDPLNVKNNREKLAHEIGLPLSRWVFARQCHSDQIKKVDHSNAGQGAYSHEDGIEEVDALYTFDADLVLSFFHADCVPVLLLDETTHLIGAIHAGWQGTLKEITKKSIQTILDNEAVDPANIKVYMGPALSYESSEIKRDDIDQELTESDYITIKDDHVKIDTVGLNIKQCLEVGIPKENIMTVNHDTYSSPLQYFSFQRDQQTGRHLSGIVRLEARESVSDDTDQF